MSPNIKNTNWTVIARVMTADKTFWRARILSTIWELWAEYVLSELMNRMWISEWDKVDIKKVEDKRWKVFMEVTRKP